jgi:hypothetical protein
MPLIAGDQMIRAGGVSGLQKHIVIGVARYLKPVIWPDNITLILD